MNRRAYFAVLTAAGLAGLSGLFIKHMSIPPTSIAWIRTAVPTLLLGSIFLFQRRKVFRSGTKYMLLASLLNVGRMYCFFYAFVHTTIGNATVILFTWPVFVTIFSAVFLKEKISKRQAGLLVMAMAGIAIIYAQDLSFSGEDFRGMTGALGAAFFYSITVVIFKSNGQNYGRFEMIFFQNLLGAFLFLPFILINAPVPTSLDWTLTISHALFLGTFAFSLFFYGLKRMKASRTSMIAYFEIVVALITAVFIMDETLSTNMLVGGAFIVGATYLLRRE